MARRKKASARARRDRDTQTAPSRLEGEALAIGALAAGVFLAVALGSHDPRDPLWGFGADVRNLCGPLGAGVAGLLAGALGHAAYLVPAALAVIALRHLRGLPFRPRWIPTAAWSGVAVALAAGLETLARGLPAAGGVLGSRAGGQLGSAIVDGLSRALYLPGTALLLGVVLWIGLVVATGVSLGATLQGLRVATRRLLRRLGGLVVVGAVRGRRRLEAWQASRRERSRERRQARELPLGGPASRAEDAPPRPAPSGEPEVVEHVQRVEAPARQTAFAFERGSERLGPFELPDLDMLARGAQDDRPVDRDYLIQNSRILEKKLADFNVTGRVVKVHPGPVITMYEFEPAPGIKLSRITNLSDDLALALRAMAVRIVAPIPGKSVVGIEVPNADREVVVLRELLSHSSYQENESKLTVALGKDIFGTPVTADLGGMPHLLVAGSTGSGKSVFLNALLCSLFFKATPDEVKLLLIDPKMLEFSNYRGVPHLITDVVTDPKRASAALRGVVMKMEERYQHMASRGVRNIEQYNRAIRKELSQGGDPTDPETGEALEPLPFIVVVIDELADLMIVAARDVEESVMRLAQMARAAGIHLVLATQRPSVDVLTGVIKANFPARIAFQVSSRTDSRTVLDSNGAERLLGLGDMLFTPPGSSALERIHGPYVSEKEVQAVVDFLNAQARPEFDPTLIRLSDDADKPDLGEERDELFDLAVDVVARHRIASISFVQRKLKIGYNRAARIFEQLEAEGVVGPQEGTKAREIYVREPDEEG